MKTETNDIRIEDLAKPQLTDIQKAALDYGDSLNVDLSVDVILQAARDNVGLSDFGAEDFLARLEILSQEWSSDEGLSGIGKLTLYNKLVQHATSRLLVEDTLKRHPEIHEQEIAKPLIVAGLPRSGTTHLLNLMAADTRFRSLPLWESYEPIPRPGEPVSDDADDPRWQRTDEAWQGMQMSTPLLASMHPMNPEHIHEELELMGPDFASYNYEWLAPSPTWRDHYYQHDQTPHYEYMKTLLKILQWRRGPNRWVLKCPQHMEQLPVLHQVFPDATIAITHRDPVEVIQSAITMLAYGQRMNRKHVDLPALLEYWSDRIERLLQACVRDRDAIPAAQSIDVPFREFMADDIAMVERIYDVANVEMTARATSELHNFMNAHPRGKEGRIIYDLPGDFGITQDQLRQRFEFYFERFPFLR
jgi:hypothetical protein